jgi:hypothetical protein
VVDLKPAKPAGFLTMLNPHILSIRGRNLGRCRSIFNLFLHACEVAGLGSCRNPCLPHRNVRRTQR